MSWDDGTSIARRFVPYPPTVAVGAILLLMDHKKDELARLEKELNRHAAESPPQGREPERGIARILRPSGHPNPINTGEHIRAIGTLLHSIETLEGELQRETRGFENELAAEIEGFGEVCTRLKIKAEGFLLAHHENRVRQIHAGLSNRFSMPEHRPKPIARGPLSRSFGSCEPSRWRTLIQSLFAALRTTRPCSLLRAELPPSESAQMDTS